MLTTTLCFLFLAEWRWGFTVPHTLLIRETQISFWFLLSLSGLSVRMYILISSMATAFPTLTDRLHCFICTEIFTQPVILSCQHTFCKRCIERSLNAALRANFQICRLIRNVANQLKLGEQRGAREEKGRGYECCERGASLKLFCVMDNELIWFICEGKGL